MSQDTPADTGFLCDKDAVFWETIKETMCMTVNLWIEGNILVVPGTANFTCVIFTLLGLMPRKEETLLLHIHPRPVTTLIYLFVSWLASLR